MLFICLAPQGRGYSWRKFKRKIRSKFIKFLAFFQNLKTCTDFIGAAVVVYEALLYGENVLRRRKYLFC